MAKRPDYKKWYDRAHWRDLKRAFLSSHPDAAQCADVDEHTGQRCNQPATEVDHIVPHKGDWNLFCDFKNLQGLCHTHHSRKTAKEDGGFGNRKQQAKPTTTFGGLTGSVSAVGGKAIDAALDTVDVDALLAGL